VSAAVPAPSCRTCTHFVGDALAFERELPGFNTLSSGFAAVRGDDGLCKQHQRFVSGQSRCEHFAALRAVRPEPETRADGCG
jgi:hypothetical protein